MKRIFVDTSALIAIGNKRDSFHLQAITIKNELKCNNTYFATTSAILLEFGNAFSSILLKPVAIQFIEAIKPAIPAHRKSMLKLRG
jgi:predicted nucleic acid-binding protein